jgi:hypothetical protein
VFILKTGDTRWEETSWGWIWNEIMVGFATLHPPYYSTIVLGKTDPCETTTVPKGGKHHD